MKRLIYFIAPFVCKWFVSGKTSVDGRDFLVDKDAVEDIVVAIFLVVITRRKSSYNSIVVIFVTSHLPLYFKLPLRRNNRTFADPFR